MKKTILVTGSSGFIGSGFIKKYRTEYNIIGIDMTEPVNQELCSVQYTGDICDKKLIDNIFQNHQINAVVHTAAEKSLIICENQQEKAYAVNYTASVNLARMAHINNAKFIFISSDQVFDGTSAWSAENSAVNPINYYGKLKTMVEAELIKINHTAICRTALVFGEIPEEQKSFFDSIKSSENLAVQGFIVQQTKYCLEHGLKIVLPDDEFVSPTHVSLLADQIDSVICHDASGILHCCGNDRISRYEIGLAIAEFYKCNSNTIQSKGTGNPLRPKDVSLSCQYTENLLEMKFPDFKTMLYKYM